MWLLLPPSVLPRFSIPATPGRFGCSITFPDANWLVRVSGALSDQSWHGKRLFPTFHSMLKSSMDSIARVSYAIILACSICQKDGLKPILPKNDMVSLPKMVLPPPDFSATLIFTIYPGATRQVNGSFPQSLATIFPRCVPSILSLAGKFKVPHHLAGKNQPIEELSVSGSKPTWDVAVHGLAVFAACQISMMREE